MRGSNPVDGLLFRSGRGGRGLRKKCSVKSGGVFLAHAASGACDVASVLSDFEVRSDGGLRQTSAGRNGRERREACLGRVIEPRDHREQNKARR